MYRKNSFVHFVHFFFLFYIDALSTFSNLNNVIIVSFSYQINECKEFIATIYQIQMRYRIWMNVGHIFMFVIHEFENF